MKNNIFKISAFSLVGAAMLVSSSCTDLIDLKPIDNYGADNFWTTADDYFGNPISLANMFRGNYAGNILFWAGELRAGQFTTALINGSGSLNDDYINNNYDIAHPQFSNFMNTPGFIADLNELIYRCENNSEGILTDAQKEGLLGYAYGMRAYTYFQIYKMWGGAVIRTEPDVLFGETNAESLYRARSTAQQTLDQIKSDIQKSLNAFNASGYDAPLTQFAGLEKDYYWNKAATEMLAGEVYLWSGKVATGDHSAGGSGDVAQAKQYFLNVVNNYGLSLYPDYFGIWTHPHNSEAIFGICYSSELDGVYASIIQNQATWASTTAGASTESWQIQGPSGFDKRAYNEETGTFSSASRFRYFSTDPTSLGAQWTNWTPWNPNPNRYMWKNAMYYQFDQADGRTAMWFPQWYITQEQVDNNVYAIVDFDPTKYDLQGTFILKMIPSYISTSTYLQLVNDQYIYRLTLAYTYLAEIANYEGNYNEIATWLNPVRKRAYGANWDESKYGFQNTGSFAENEAIILREKNKEFIMEGQRWWDLRRMTTVKDGSQTDHMVFQPQGCIGYGLDPVTNPWMVEAGGQGNQRTIETLTPVLTTAEEYKLLWPIDQTLLGSDPLVTQNPGYASSEN